MTSSKEFRLAVVSDIHLGHKKNETEFIIGNLQRAFPDNAETAQLDLIVLAGDVFDGLLTLPDMSVAAIHFWIASFLQLCKKHDITVRVLEGTPSHDRQQSKMFTVINEAAAIDCDLKYVDELTIEYNPKFDMNFLYVPDEWEPTTERTLMQVHELMKIKHLDKVDFAFMHGQFEHQLPPVVKAPKHDAQAYLKLVDKLIFIGHVHIFSRYDRIIAQGSFDRLSHGEESPKGHVRACWRSHDDYEITFVENKGARKFITIECQGLTTEETLREVHEATQHLEDGSFVRISAYKDNPILTEMNQLVLYRPLISWSKIVRDEVKPQSLIDSPVFNQHTFTPITITRDNIVKLVMDRLLSKNTDPAYLDACEQLVNDMR